MFQIDAAVTHAINGSAEKSLAADFLAIWISALGIPLLVLAAATQWWRKTNRRQSVT